MAHLSVKQVMKKILMKPFTSNGPFCVKLHPNEQRGIQVVFGLLAVVGLLAVIINHIMKPSTLIFVRVEDMVLNSYLHGDGDQNTGRDRGAKMDSNHSCNDSCTFQLVESLPWDMPYQPNSSAAKPLYQAWMELLNMTQESIHVASYYWALTGEDVGVNDTSSKQGEDILKKFESLLLENISVFIATSVPSKVKHSTDLEILKRKDRKHIFLGSANVDWRALTQASPPSFCPGGRTFDLVAVLDVIYDAEEYVYVSMMEYFPTSRFRHPPRYWPPIDNALKDVALDHNIRVRLLVSCWIHTDSSMFHYLKSLSVLNNPSANITIEVKIFIVPIGNHSNIPFARLNHNKYMVTEKAAYVGKCCGLE
ncbi:hypothetical protein JD844_020593 [Phrynosoma platyrhinos]|uniref:PLD-like domain-containing protein n=1 Tax=Phrynosoma platyrhinos TaxID=52577 RepID=A0ABQ7SSC3_PHRPL|nr:hypothetical protein JD844_020593 [Phrynosoma platyrhinos]